MGQALSGLGYVKQTDLTGYTKTTDLTGYAKTTDLTSYTKTTDLTGYAKTTDLTGYAKTTDLTGYAKTGDLGGYVKIANGAPYKLNEAGDSVLMTKSGKGILRYNDAGVNVDDGIFVVGGRNILSAIDAKANQVDLLAVGDKVNSKANQADFSTLSNTLNSKANQADFSILSNTLNSKANQADLLIVGAKVDTKADKESIINYNNAVDFTLGATNLTRGDTRNSRAMVKDGGGQLNINYANDFFGGVVINATSGGLKISGQTTMTKLPSHNQAALRINGAVPAIDENLYSISYGPEADLTGTGIVPNTRKQFSDTTGDILATHMQENREFSLYSNGWNPLFSVQGRTGNAKIKGNLTVNNRNILTDIDSKANQAYVNQLVTANTLTDLNGKTMWCADGELCKIPTGKRGIDWGFGSTKIIDDGTLKIQTDDDIYLQTMNNGKTIRMDASGDLIMGPGQKICNNDKSVCLEVGDIVNTKQNFGVESVTKIGKVPSKLTTWGDVPGWRDNWDVSDGRNWSQIKFTKF